MSGDVAEPAGPGRASAWLPAFACGLLIIGPAVAAFWADATRSLPEWKNSGWIIFSIFSDAPRLTPFPRPTGLFMLDGTVFAGQSYYLGWYWCVAMAVGCLATVLWARRRAPLSSHPAIARGLVAVTAGATALTLALPFLAPVVPALPRLWLHHLWVDGVPVLVVIGAGLAAAAWSARSRALAVLAGGYAAVALLAGWLLARQVDPVGPWLLPGGPTARWQWFLADPRSALALPALVLMGAGLARIRRRS